jgi:hypothetical protein
MCLSRGRVRLVSIRRDSKHAAYGDWWIESHLAANRERGVHVGPSFAEGRKGDVFPTEGLEEELSLHCRPVILNV